jgi:hypothetical protein
MASGWGIARQLVHVEKKNLLIRRSIRTAAVATGLPLIAWAAGMPEAIVPLGVGALFVGISESNIHPVRRARFMLWTTAWLMVTSAVGFLIADSPIAVVLVSAVVAAATGWVGVAGPSVGLVGVLSLVLFTITVGVPDSMRLSVASVAFVGLGGVAQVAVFLIVDRARSGRAGTPPPRATTTLWFRLTHPGDQRAMFVRHALGVMIAIAVATTISQFLEVPHQYWIPMTVAWIFKPDLKDTVRRVTERVVGTLAAIGVAFLWETYVGSGHGLRLIIAGVGAYLLLAFLTANYTVATFGVTSFVLALFAMAGDLYEQTVIFRLLATLAAGAIVLAVIFSARGIASRRSLHI